MSGALSSYRRAQTITEAQAAADPADAEARRDLAISHELVGGILAKTNDSAGALQNFRTALGIRETLVAANPTNALARRDLSQSHNEIGDLMAKMGDLTKALDNYRQGLAIAEALAAAAGLADAQARRDLADSYSKVGQGYALLASRKGVPDAQRKEHYRQARNWYQRGLELWLDLRQRDHLSAFDAGQPDKIASEIARCDAALQAQ